MENPQSINTTTRYNQRMPPSKRSRPSQLAGKWKKLADIAAPGHKWNEVSGARMLTRGKNFAFLEQLKSRWVATPQLEVQVLLRLAAKRTWGQLDPARQRDVVARIIHFHTQEASMHSGKIQRRPRIREQPLTDRELARRVAQDEPEPLKLPETGEASLIQAYARICEIAFGSKAFFDSIPKTDPRYAAAKDQYTQYQNLMMYYGNALKWLRENKRMS